MKGSEFLARHSKSSLPAWEDDVLSLAHAASSGDQDSLVLWPKFPVDVHTSQHSGTFFAAADYLAVGEPSDFVRIPLTPIVAQKVADALDMMLPTPKMVDDIAQVATVRLEPMSAVELPSQRQNLGANLSQYAEHSSAVDHQLLTLGDGIFPLALTSGGKKDIVVGNLVTPGKVVIYGWHRPDGSHIQPRTNVHGDFYVDYSHGVRLIHPVMMVDGKSISVQEVLSDPDLSSLLSDEGRVPPAKQRYATRKTSSSGLSALVEHLFTRPVAKVAFA